MDLFNVWITFEFRCVSMHIFDNYIRKIECPIPHVKISNVLQNEWYQKTYSEFSRSRIMSPSILNNYLINTCQGTFFLKNEQLNRKCFKPQRGSIRRKSVFHFLTPVNKDNTHEKMHLFQSIPFRIFNIFDTHTGHKK